DLLETVGGGLDARVLVGMVLARELPVSLLDRLGVGGLRDAEDLVVVLVGNGHEGILAGAAPAAQARAGTGAPARRRGSSSPSSVSRTFSTPAGRRRMSLLAPRSARTRSYVCSTRRRPSSSRARAVSSLYSRSPPPHPGPLRRRKRGPPSPPKASGPSRSDIPYRM